MINIVKARKILSKECIGFLTHMVSEIESSLSIEETLVVKEFLVVFSIELSGLAPKREIKLSIELVLNTTPYKMALTKLQELNKQL